MDELERIQCSFGQSYDDLLAARDGGAFATTDAVIAPGSTEELLHILSEAARMDIAVVPRGGGTSQWGEEAPLAGPHHAVVTISLHRLDHFLGIDPRADTAQFEAGIFGPALEEQLNSRGLTLGHFPLSYEFSTLGGWIATASIGQSAGHYGTAIDRVRGARWATPTGALSWQAGGPSPRGIDPALLLRSRGTLGVISSVTVRIETAPDSSPVRAVLVPSWEAALKVLRALFADVPRPALARMSDPLESRFLLTLAQGRPPEETGGFEGFAVRRRIRDLRSVVFGVVGFDGVTSRKAGVGMYVLDGLIRQAGGTVLPGGTWPGLGDSWRRTRFRSPALRGAAVLDGWVMEPLDVWTSWTEAISIPQRVRVAVDASLAPFDRRARVHVQARNPVGESVNLLFTIFYPEPFGAGHEAWRAVRSAVSDATLLRASGAGRSRGDYPLAGNGAPLTDEASRWRAAQRLVDPSGILNPGKYPSSD
ncbi:MAG: FAD-binding oxidoreductase [Thermoplasmata archaeon]